MLKKILGRIKDHYQKNYAPQYLTALVRLLNKDKEIAKQFPRSDFGPSRTEDGWFKKSTFIPKHPNITIRGDERSNRPALFSDGKRVNPDLEPKISRILLNQAVNIKLKDRIRTDRDKNPDLYETDFTSEAEKRRTQHLLKVVQNVAQELEPLLEPSRVKIKIANKKFEPFLEVH